MRAYFAPNGIGLGHIGRCIPIANALKEKGVEVLFSSWGEAVNYARKEDMEVLKAPEMYFQTKEDGSLDVKLSLVNPGPFIGLYRLLKQITSEIETLKRYRPDVVISDSRISPIIAAKAFNLPSVCILNQFQIIVPRRRRFLRLSKLADAGSLALIGWIWTLADNVLIPDFPPPYAISAAHLHIPKPYRKHVHFIGPIMRKTPDELPDKMELRKKLGVSSEKKLILASISGPLREKAFFETMLCKSLSGFPKKYEIVISLGKPDGSSIPVRRENLTIYDWLPDRFEFLKASDLLIARAGHETIMQAIAYRKPLILIPTPNHTEQYNNSRKALNLGIAKVIEQDKLTKETLLKMVKQMLKLESFEENIERILRENGDLIGTEAAVQTILELMEERSVHQS